MRKRTDFGIGIWVLAFACIGAVAAAQPVIRTVVNSASYLTPGLPNSGIAQGAIFVAYGDGLGPAQLAQAQSLPLGTELAGTSVQVTANGIAYPAPLVYVSQTAVSAIFPSKVPEGNAVVTVTYNGAVSNPFTTLVRKAAFGIFTQNQAGLGPAVLQNWTLTRVAVNGLFSVILPGQIGILWGTGLGAIDQSDADIPPAGDLSAEVQVLVGGESAKVLYHGRSPTFPGLDQINFEVPSGVFGCYVPLAVVAGGVMSNFASISIGSSGSACGDDISWRGRLWSNVAANVRVGMVQMIHQEYTTPAGSPIFWSDTGTAHFYEILKSDLNILPALAELQVLPGTCTVIWNHWGNSDEMANFYPALNLPAVPAQPGDFLEITGPAGTKSLGQASPGEYEAHLGGMDELGGAAAPRFILAGAYTFDNKPAQPPAARSAAATDLLSIPLTIPGEITWTNRAQLAQVDRSQDLTFTWSGGMDGQEYVVAGGSSADESLQTRVTFLCAENPSAGKLKVPSALLSILPRSSVSQPNLFPYGLLLVASSSRNTNSLDPTVALGTFNMLYFRYLLESISVVDFR